MARRKTDTRPSGDLVCDTCQVDMGTEHTTNYGKFSGWKHGPVLHCEGSSIAFGCRRNGTPHHGHRLFSCPECGFHLGCTHCLDTNPMCLKCHVYADGSHIMTQERAKKAWRLVYLVLDKKMTTEQALDALEKLGNEGKVTEMVQEECPF